MGLLLNGMAPHGEDKVHQDQQVHKGVMVLKVQQDPQVLKAQ